MTNIYTPAWRHMTALEAVDLQDNTVMLPDAFHGKPTLLFLGFTYSSRHVFETIEKMWNDIHGTDNRVQLYAVGIIVNPVWRTKLMATRIQSGMKKKTPEEDWPFRATKLLDKSTATDWLVRNGIAEYVDKDDGVEPKEGVPKGKKTKTIKQSVLMLIDGDGTIRRVLVNISKRTVETQHDEILDIIRETGSVSARKARQPTNPLSPVGIGEDHSYLLE